MFLGLDVWNYKGLEVMVWFLRFVVLLWVLGLVFVGCFGFVDLDDVILSLLRLCCVC